MNKIIGLVANAPLKNQSIPEPSKLSEHLWLSSNENSIASLFAKPTNVEEYNIIEGRLLLYHNFILLRTKSNFCLYIAFQYINILFTVPYENEGVKIDNTEGTIYGRYPDVYDQGISYLHL